MSPIIEEYPDLDPDKIIICVNWEESYGSEFTAGMARGHATVGTRKRAAPGSIAAFGPGTPESYGNDHNLHTGQQREQQHAGTAAEPVRLRRGQAQYASGDAAGMSVPLQRQQASDEESHHPAGHRTLPYAAADPAGNRHRGARFYQSSSTAGYGGPSHHGRYTVPVLL